MHHIKPAPQNNTSPFRPDPSAPTRSIHKAQVTGARTARPGRSRYLSLNLAPCLVLRDPDVGEAEKSPVRMCNRTPPVLGRVMRRLKVRFGGKHPGVFFIIFLWIFWWRFFNSYQWKTLPINLKLPENILSAICLLFTKPSSAQFWHGYLQELQDILQIFQGLSLPVCPHFSLMPRNCSPF